MKLCKVFLFLAAVVIGVTVASNCWAKVAEGPYDTGGDYLSIPAANPAHFVLPSTQDDPSVPVPTGPTAAPIDPSVTTPPPATPPADPNYGAGDTVYTTKTIPIFTQSGGGGQGGFGNLYTPAGTLPAGTQVTIVSTNPVTVSQVGDQKILAGMGTQEYVLSVPGVGKVSAIPNSFEEWIPFVGPYFTKDKPKGK